MDVENVLAKVSDNLSVRRAFGAAYEKDGLLIIPVAMVAGGGGGGTSRSRHQHGNSAARPETLAAPDTAAQESGPADAGGGFGGLVLPSGAYVVKGDQVRWVPAVDTTIVVLASLALVRMLAAALVRISRNRGRR
jgi:uncharacterized spore protein YtfJ